MNIHLPPTLMFTRDRVLTHSHILKRLPSPAAPCFGEPSGDFRLLPAQLPSSSSRSRKAPRLASGWKGAVRELGIAIFGPFYKGAKETPGILEGQSIPEFQALTLLPRRLDCLGSICVRLRDPKWKPGTWARQELVWLLVFEPHP